MAVALRRRHPYDVLWMHGRADAIARDTTLKGTALSAPVSNLLLQAALTVVVARRPSPGAARALGGLGALQVAGYLGERLVRRRLRPSGWDAVESPLVLAGIGLAGAMAALGRQGQQPDGPVRPPSPIRARRSGGRGRSVREGSLHGGLPYLAVGQGPPLVVFSGLSAEHANPTGLARRFELQTLKPMARHFTVYAVNRKPGLPAGSTIGDLAGHYAQAIAHEFQGPVAMRGFPPAARLPSSSPSTTPTWSAGWCWPRPPADCHPTAGRCSAASPSSLSRADHGGRMRPWGPRWPRRRPVAAPSPA